MASKTSHIAVASSEGMREGYRAYQRKLRSSGLPAVQEKAASFVGNKGFKLYCATFGADVDAAKGVLAPAKPGLFRRSSRPVVTTPATLTEREILLARLAELDAPAAPVTPKATPKPKTAKENLWRAWAVRKFNIPTTVGETFVYTSKKTRKSSTHRVTRVTTDGCYTIKVA